ncbi:serine hydrolase [Flavobacteriaceae bacterium]|nr:serine hydrolase [Flavobacteriaceae bacterium]MDC0103743.1 serine hydrolase [Flavobacteriaceae bacterium]MDC1518815.1 serine hydrolase [Flavobacteriaceae bacterium]
MQYGIQNRAFPGAQVLIFKNDSIQLNKSYGYQTYDSLNPITNSNLYDLASVTKVLASTLAFMKLYELYDIDLNKKVSSYIPLLKRSNKKNTSFKEVLSHSGGWIPYIAHQNLIYKKNGDYKNRTVSSKQNDKYPTQISDSLFIHKKYAKKILSRIKKTKIGDSGTYLYSGLWFFLLPELTLELSGLSFTGFLNTHFYSPLKLKRLTFLPSNQFPKDKIVPTEIDSLFRKKLVQGWVHDEAAAMMGGISGNAGLFANASSIAPLLKMFLQKGSIDGIQLLKPKTLELFTQRTFPQSENRRGLGFDKPSIKIDDPYPSELVSPESYGHSGFTGTFIWVDPIDKSFVVFLSNRVYPSRNQRGLYELGIRRKLLNVTIEN